MARPQVVIVAIAIAIAALAIAWWLRWGTDDAFISYVYAKRLVAGDGLTWFGTPIEGYTNFGWVMWIAGGLALGADPLVWAWAASLASLVAVVLVTARIAGMRTTPLAAICAASVLATNYTFLAFGTSGLETMAQTALIAVAWWNVEKVRRDPPSAARLAGLSVTCALALWMRLDSAVPCVVLGAVVAHRLVTSRASAALWAAAVVPVLVLVGGWLAWKLAYYGDILPNTFYVKAGSGAVGQGAAYTAAFLRAYLLWPFLVAVAVISAVRRELTSRLPAVLVAVWIAYVIAVGGDFIEFRFFVPMLPALAVLVAELVTLPAPARVPGPRLRAGAALAILAAFSLRHGLTFRNERTVEYDSVPSLSTFYGRVPGGRDWGRLGRPLHDVLTGTGATLACDGAGIIPYYADLPTVDQLGLNDAWVARNGARPPASYTRPGHQRFATYEYLVQRGVTFVIGTPTLIAHGALRGMPPIVRAWMASILGFTPLPAQGTYDLVAAPINPKQDLLLWYLTPSAEITATIRAAGWELVRVHGRAPNTE